MHFADRICLSYQTREQTVRGVFSTSEIGKRLGHDVSDVMTGAQSLAELQQVIGKST